MLRACWYNQIVVFLSVLISSLRAVAAVPKLQRGTTRILGTYTKSGPPGTSVSAAARPLPRVGPATPLKSLIARMFCLFVLRLHLFSSLGLGSVIHAAFFSF